MMQVGAESASALLGWALLSSYKGPNWQSKLGHIYIGTYIKVDISRKYVDIVLVCFCALTFAIIYNNLSNGKVNKV